MATTHALAAAPGAATERPMAAPPSPHAPVDSDDPAVLSLGPCAAAYVALEVGQGPGLSVRRPDADAFQHPLLRHRLASATPAGTGPSANSRWPR